MNWWRLTCCHCSIWRLLMFRVVWLPVCWPLWVCVRLAGVGKSSILLRFTDDVFDDVAPTIGVDFKVKALDVDGRRVKITAWDTGTFSISLRWVSRGVSSGGAVSLSFPRQPIRSVQFTRVCVRALSSGRPRCCLGAPFCESCALGPISDTRLVLVPYVSVPLVHPLRLPLSRWHGGGVALAPTRSRPGALPHPHLCLLSRRARGGARL